MTSPEKVGVFTELDQRYKLVMQALERVHGFADGEGVTTCPACGGGLHYEKRTTKTGREWSKAMCDGEDCISWIV